MTTGCPKVICLKWYISSGIDHRSLLSFPNSLLEPMAAMMEIFSCTILKTSYYGNLAFNRRGRGVTDNLKISKFKIINFFDCRINLHDRQRSWSSGQLFLYLVKMIFIDVDIAESMDEISRFIAGHLGQHQRQKGITGNIKRHPQKRISASLIKKKRQFITGNI